MPDGNESQKISSLLVQPAVSVISSGFTACMMTFESSFSFIQMFPEEGRK